MRHDAFSIELRFRRSVIQATEFYLDPDLGRDGLSCRCATKDTELTEEQTCAEGCASLLHLATRFSLRFALYTSFSSRSTLSALYRFLSPLLTLPPPVPLSPPRVHLRSPDTNGQSKLRHYEVPGAEVTPLWSHPPFWRCRHHPRERNSPWTFTERKGPPLLPPVTRTRQPAQKGTRNLLRRTNSALAINICANNVSQMKFNNGQTDYSRAHRPCIYVEHELQKLMSIRLIKYVEHFEINVRAIEARFIARKCE